MKKKLLSLAMSLVVGMVSLPFVKVTPAQAASYRRVIIWQKAPACVYWYKNTTEYGYNIMFMDNDFDEYWLSTSHPVPSHLLTRFDPLITPTYTEVYVSQNLLDNSYYFLHCV